MSENTLIEWCNKTWSPWLGCRRVSPGCGNCYLERSTPIRVKGIKHGGPRQRTSPSYWRQPLKWNRDAGLPRAGCKGQYPRPSVFPSLCDWLDEEVPIEWLAEFLKLIHDTPNLDWLLLTKRAQHFRERRSRAMEFIGRGRPQPELEKWLLDWEVGNAPANIWIGVSVEDQQRADERIPELLKIPAKVRFLSVEPLLGMVDLSFVENDGYKLNCLTGTQRDMGRPCEDASKADWVIVGGESGPKSRPCNVEWIRSIVSQCQSAGVPCFVKQLGSKPEGGKWPQRDWSSMRHPKGGDPSEWPHDLRVREFPQKKETRLMKRSPN